MNARFITGGTIACIAVLTFALSGCSSSDFDMANRECRNTVDVPAWDQCIEHYNFKVAEREMWREAAAARDAQRQSEATAESGSDWAAMLLLGATAFANGYTHARPATTTCFTTGMMTQCTTP